MTISTARSAARAGDGGRWRSRVDGGDWDQVAAELDEFGGALLPRLHDAS